MQNWVRLILKSHCHCRTVKGTTIITWCIWPKLQQRMQTALLWILLCTATEAGCRNCQHKLNQTVKSQTNNTLRMIACLSFNRNFPLPRSACPNYFLTMNEWYLGHDCLHIIYRSNYNHKWPRKWRSDSANQSMRGHEYHWSVVKTLHEQVLIIMQIRINRF